MKFFHLRQSYTVAVKRRTDGHYSVSICQCNPSGTYSAQLGSRIAAQRLKHGMFFVQSRDALIATLRTLQQKEWLRTYRIPFTESRTGRINVLRACV